MQKTQAQSGQEYVRKVRRAETAGTTRARIPAESEEMRKRVYLERIRFAFQRSTMEKTFPVVSP